MVNSTDVLILFSVVIIGALIFYWIQQRKKPLRNEFNLRILLENEIVTEKKLTTEKSHTFIIKNREYPCNIQDAWIIPLGIGDKLISRIKNRYLFLYRIPQKNSKQKNDPEPTIIKQAQIPTNSSLILWKVKKYRGVKEGIEDQFKEPRQFEIPSWALVIVVIALLILGVVLLDSMGYLGTGQAAKEAAKGVIFNV